MDPVDETNTAKAGAARHKAMAGAPNQHGASLGDTTLWSTGQRDESSHAPMATSGRAGAGEELFEGEMIRAAL